VPPSERPVPDLELKTDRANLIIRKITNPQKSRPTNIPHGPEKKAPDPHIQSVYPAPCPNIVYPPCKKFLMFAISITGIVPVYEKCVNEPITY